MIEHIKKAPRKGVYQKPVAKYTEDIRLGDVANKKEQIVKVLTEGRQLTLLATVLMQVCDAVGVDTAESAELKTVYSSIFNILKDN